MAKLYFIYSTMNAGKTTHLLQYNFNYTEKNLKTALFVPYIASKHGIIKSRLGLVRKAIVIKRNFNIYKYIKKQNLKFDCLFFDEVQFLEKKQIYELVSIVDNLKISIITYGLKTDFKSRLFNSSKHLLSLSDKLIEIKSLCKCGLKSVMNIRFKDGKKTLTGDQIDIDKNKYTSSCRIHYYMSNIIN